jgi:hypothetical protein
MKTSVVGGVCLLAGLLVPRPSAAGDAILTWSEHAGNAAIAACLILSGNGLAESRMYAMTHVAMHDALNAIERHSRPYAFDGDAPATASRDAAIATAARDVLVSVIGELPESPACVANGIAAVDAFYATALAAIPDGEPKSAGTTVGHQAADAILALRASDGSNQPLLDFAYPQGDEPGEYRFTEGFPFVFAPNWGRVSPFVLKRASQFRAKPPYKVSSKRYAADFNEIKAIGGDNVTTPSTRTPDQTEIGLFWIESSPTAWNRLARAVSASQGLDIWENARLFALLTVAMADGYIGSWDSKYHYNFWRPVTGIHLADTDGNPETVADPTWTPLQLTYPIPDHDSGHAVQGGVAAEVLKQVFGTDTMAFLACSETLPAGSRCNDPSPRLRSYSSFSQAADENAVSRILIGIHFRRAVEEGVVHGRKIAHRAVNLYFQQVHH